MKLHVKRVQLDGVCVGLDEVNRVAALSPGLHITIFASAVESGQMKLGPFSLELFT